MSKLSHSKASGHAVESQDTLFQPVRELVGSSTRSDGSQEESTIEKKRTREIEGQQSTRCRRRRRKLGAAKKKKMAELKGGAQRSVLVQKQLTSVLRNESKRRGQLEGEHGSVGYLGSSWRMSNRPRTNSNQFHSKERRRGGQYSQYAGEPKTRVGDRGSITHLLVKTSSFSLVTK